MSSIQLNSAPFFFGGNPTLRSILLTLLGVLAPVLASCGATAKFKATTTAIAFERNLSPHPDCMPGSLELRVFADMLDDDQFKQDLGASLRKKAGEMFTASSRVAQEAGKKPHYIIQITQMTEDSKFEASEEAAIYGALFGAAGGAAIAGEGNRAEGAGWGALAGAAGGLLAGGEKKRNYHFMVRIQQMTSADGAATLENRSDNKSGTAGGSRDEDTGTVVGTDEAHVVTASSRFDIKDNYFKQSGAFMIACEGGAFSNEEKAIAAAKQAIVEKLPGFLTGGALIDF